MLSFVADYKSSLDESAGYGSSKLFPVFDKGFEEYCEMWASELAEFKDDPNLRYYKND